MLPRRVHRRQARPQLQPAAVGIAQGEILDGDLAGAGVESEVEADVARSVNVVGDLEAPEVGFDLQLLERVRQIDADVAALPLFRAGRAADGQPFDAGTVPDIERALKESKIGITPSVDGKIIRLPIPELSEERRKELARSLGKMAEDARVHVRANRRSAPTMPSIASSRIEPRNLSVRSVACRSRRQSATTWSSTWPSKSMMKQ